MRRSNAIAIRYRLDVLIRSHFMSGRMTKPAVGESSLERILSASETPVRMFSTLTVGYGQYEAAGRQMHDVPLCPRRGERLDIWFYYALVYIRSLVDHDNSLVGILRTLSV